MRLPVCCYSFTVITTIAIIIGRLMGNSNHIHNTIPTARRQRARHTAYAKAESLIIVVSVFLRIHNPSAWKLKKFTSFWHLNVGMILIRQCVQTMLLLIIDFAPPLYYVLHLLFWGDTYDLVASFSSSCQCWFYWHGSRPQHRSALLVGRWFFFLPKM